MSGQAPLSPEELAQRYADLLVLGKAFRRMLRAEEGPGAWPQGLSLWPPDDYRDGDQDPALLVLRGEWELAPAEYEAVRRAMDTP